MEWLSNLSPVWILVGIFILIIVAFILGRFSDLQKNITQLRRIRENISTDLDIIPAGQSINEFTGRNLEYQRLNYLLRKLETPNMSDAHKRRMLNELRHYSNALLHSPKEAEAAIFHKYLGERQKTSVLETKKDQFINLPNIRFHFVDKGQVESYYDDYFKEPTIESLVSEITGEVDAEVKANLPQIIESKIGSKDISKWMSTIKLPDVTLNRKFLRYQKETLKNEQVVLGIEEVEIELTELEKFENSVENFEKRYGLIVAEDQLKTTRATLREKQQEKH